MEKLVKNKKRERTTRIMLILMILIISSLIFLFVVRNYSIRDWAYRLPYTIQFKLRGYTKENAITICSEKNLVGTAFCLNSLVRGIYNYRVTYEQNMSFETLKEEGGDCANYADLYLELVRELGFEAEYIVYCWDYYGVGPMKGECYVYHAYVNAYENGNVCILNLRNIYCTKVTGEEYETS